jgi:hypothetical protein
MLLRNKTIQVCLVSGAVIITSLAAGCSANATTPAGLQPAVSVVAKPAATSVTANQPSAPESQPAAPPASAPNQTADATNQKAPVNSGGGSPAVQINDSLSKVAAILGIDQQKLTDAFTQAMAAVGSNGPSGGPNGTIMPAPSGSVRPNPPSGSGMPTPTGTRPVPTGFPNQGGAQPGMSKEVLAKMASILGIDQQKLEDAFNQVMKQP